MGRPMADLDITGRVTVDASQAEGAFDRVGARAEQMSEAVAGAAGRSGRSIESLGAAGVQSGEKMTRSQSRVRDEIVRSTTAIERLGKTASQRLELKISTKGLDPALFAPYLARLREVEAAQAALARSGREAARAAQETGGSFGAMGGGAALAARAIGALAAAFSVSEFVRLADAATNVTARLRLVTDSAEELTSVQARLFDVAQNSRVSFVDLAGTYAQLARSTKELGVSQDALLGVIATVSKAVTISGGSAESARAALTQLSQGFASGALRGEELNSVLEQTPRLAQAIAQGLGVSIGELRELGKAGELSAEAVLGALQKSAGAVEQEFGRIPLTVGQASTQAANSFLKLVGVTDGIAGASAGAARGISRFARGLDTLSSDINALAGSSNLSDFFFLASNNSKSLGRDLEVTQKEIARLDALLASNPSNAFAQKAARDMRAYADEIRNAQARLADLSGQAGPGGGANFGNERSREASRQQEIRQRTKLSDDANAFRNKRDGVPASYLKDMQELIRLNKAGAITAKEYTEELARMQATLFKKPAGSGRSGASGAANSQIQKAKKDEEDFQSFLRSFDNARYDYLSNRNDKLLREKEQQEADHQDFLRGFDNARYDYLAERNEGLLRAEEDAQKERLELIENANQTLYTDVKSALSNAFRDTKDPIRAFGDALANVVFTRVSSSLARSIVDGLLGIGGKGGGLFGSLFSFDGGGYTGNGPRSGGMDGRGGFMAMVHPKESVIDHTKGQSGGGQSGMTVVNYFSITGPTDRRTETQIAAAAQRGIQRGARNL